MLQVAEFAAAWQATDADLRNAAETQAEQVLRCREARDALWDLCDGRQEANESRASQIRYARISLPALNTCPSRSPHYAILEYVTCSSVYAGLLLC